MVEVGMIVEEAVPMKVSTKIILEENLDVGYAIKTTTQRRMSIKQ